MSSRPARYLAAAAVLLLVIIGVLEAGASQASVTPARAMRDFWYVFALFAVAWLVLLGWIFSIIRRIVRLERRSGR